MKILDLFSGIGGFSLAASWVWGDELEIVAFCEKDLFCQKVLNKNFPGVFIYDDIKDVHGVIANTPDRKDDRREGRILVEETVCRQSINSAFIAGHQDADEIDLLTGGFPCQPFSCAGQRKGKEDDRYLWPEMLRVISEIKPVWVIAENVGGFITISDGMEFEHCFSDLESQGYEVQAFIIPACAVNAPHRRDRVWIVANSKETMCKRAGTTRARETRFTNGYQDASDGWSTLSRMGNVVNGIPSRMAEHFDREPDISRTSTGEKDRVNKLKALGNSIVPQVAYEIMKAIKKVQDER